MAANVGMVGIRCPPEQDMCGMQKEVAFETRLFQSHVKTSSRHRCALVEYIGWVPISVRAVDV
jgi:hypothetical protein